MRARSSATSTARRRSTSGWPPRCPSGSHCSCSAPARVCPGGLESRPLPRRSGRGAGDPEHSPKLDHRPEGNMTPQLSELVLPVMTYALDLKNRVDGGESLDLEAE